MKEEKKKKTKKKKKKKIRKGAVQSSHVGPDPQKKKEGKLDPRSWGGKKKEGGNFAFYVDGYGREGKKREELRPILPPWKGKKKKRREGKGDRHGLYIFLPPSFP